MEASDPGADEAARLDEVRVGQQHVVARGPPDTRHEHAAALYKGRYYLKITGTFVHFYFAVFRGFFFNFLE